ncbi:hypothetical protein HYPSUDRAFT_142114 [Hypholoma sublateritium FD-334 SS-4]|uniref:Prokaryotic-type class I peptide chain release factors domain-containing protein n=1 Tax=Hypholoma sublateritium (strain FD-334 SS-4) TaxID=945553 RepID=A0A0D2MAY1_HYPSF|nr:hypothetical protein HYPSUDRAFT_142114 [Hypholoma sublateritium FD-334 SS-4]
MHTAPTIPPNPTPPPLPTPPAFSELHTEQENAAASAWVKAFSEVPTGISRDMVELSFSRSSGPGGQARLTSNVNKVNTKATLHCPLHQSWIPQWAVPNLAKDTHYVASTHSILVTSTVHRSQLQNINECLEKLHALILSAASKSIKHGPTAEQKKKVQELMKVERERRKMDKIHRSSIKHARSSNKRGLDF